jgi:hypothetical protein
MAVATYCKKYPSDGEKGKHLPGLRTGIPPTVNAGVETFGKFFMLKKIEPCNFVII